MTAAPVLVWFRRDLRLADQPALRAAAETGRPVIPVFILDEIAEGYGAAFKWRHGLGVARLARELAARGSRLILRRGPAAGALLALARQSGAGTVLWSRAYDPDAVARDRTVKSALTEAGLEALSLPGHLLFEPWRVETGSGGPYRVFTPFWKAVRGRDVPAPVPAPRELRPPSSWPESENLDDWQMGAAMNRGAEVVAAHVRVGEAAARDRLDAFIDHGIARYGERRDMLAEAGTSGLSENLAHGEISIATCWHAGMAAREAGKAGAETWLKELCWREFAYHLAWHTPRLLRGNWREEWDAFAWATDPGGAEFTAWTRARTGMAAVDAGLRQMYVTGTMHNRARMIVASYLTKHLMCHWRLGLKWFADCLVDWDPASNALGWQWVAGSGPDAAPFFRIFNPETQRKKFDPEGAYLRAWIAEGQADPPASARDYFRAVPRTWGLDPADTYPDPVVSAEGGRRRALEAYAARRG